MEDGVVKDTFANKLRRFSSTAEADESGRGSITRRPNWRDNSFTTHEMRKSNSITAITSKLTRSESPSLKLNRSESPGSRPGSVVDNSYDSIGRGSRSNSTSSNASSTHSDISPPAPNVPSPSANPTRIEEFPEVEETKAPPVLMKKVCEFICFIEAS